MITFEKAMDLVELELKDSGLEIGNVLVNTSSSGIPMTLICPPLG